MSTSASSKTSSKRNAAIDRPFDRSVLTRARTIADQYQVVMWREAGHYYGHGVELPTTFGDGKTIQACEASLRAGFVATVASMIEDGETPPAPANENIRTEQINIRLTPAEKHRLSVRAQQKGFRGISDFVRNAALSTQ